jgi:hypothetical protein
MQIVAYRLSRVGAALLAVAVVAALFLIMLASSALADSQVGPADSGDNLHLVQVLNVVVATVLPLLVALVTKTTTSPGAKAWLLAFLTVLGAFITTYVNNPDSFDVWGAVLTAITSFLVSIGLHYGLWKPTGVATKANAALTG